MPQKIIISDFIEGVDSDSDVLRIKRTKLRDSLNTVVVTVDGKSVVRTPIAGFSYEFSLTPDYEPLGCCQYNGILYIISWNPNSGIGEIGSYPSPNPNCAGGLTHDYRPLNNFTGNVNPLAVPNTPRFELRTPLFTFDCLHQIDMEPRDDYDGSVNLYFADAKNPLRFINSGFDQSGKCNNRLYWNGSFPGAIEANGETCMYVQAEITDIPANAGQVQAGSFWFHFRYTTVDFNPTSFLGHTGPAQISPDADNTNVLIDGGVALLPQTNKAVKLHLSNLDTNYPFIEVAVVYFYNNVQDVALLDNRYPINAQTGECDITYTGLENVIDGFVFDNLVSKKITDDIPRSIGQIENQLWQGNMKSRPVMDQQLIDFAKLIRPKYNDSKQIGDSPFLDNVDRSFYQYKKWENTYENVGYFRGEPYAFAIVGVLKSGRKTKPVPIKGGDDWLGFINYDNDNGIYRFPNWNVSNPRDNIDTIGHGYINVLGVRFDTTLAQAYLNTLPASNFIDDELCGFYFVRAKRKPMLLYQGLVLDAYSAEGMDDGGDTLHRTTDYIPMWTGANDGNNYGTLPMTAKDAGGAIQCNDDSISTVCFMSTYATGAKAGKFGIYSMDHFFLRSLADGPYTILKVADMTPSYDKLDFDSVLAKARVYDTYAMAYVNPAQQANKGTLQLHNIAPWQPIPHHGFASYFAEGDPGVGFYYQHFTGGGGQKSYNRAFASPAYIGVDRTASISSQLPDIDIDSGNANGISIVNVYSINPLSFTSAQLAEYYDTDNEQYYEISDFIPKASFFPLTNAETFYRGDCFLQRTYQRQRLDPTYGVQQQYADSGAPSAGGRFGGHGVIHGMVTENSINTAMRIQEPGRKYYPATGINFWDGNLFRDYGSQEAEARNAGYDNTLPVEFQYAVNLQTLLGTTNRFPTRIRYTARHVHNSFTDGYKHTEPDWYKDFDFRMGEIVAVVAFNGVLVSVQESGISIHSINQQSALQDLQGEDILLGKGDVLNQKSKVITDQIGSQNQWSIYHTPLGLVGVDAFKQKIWFLKNDFSLDIVSDTQQYSARITELFNRRTTHSDFLHKMEDAPVCDEGIVTGYDFRTGNIFFTFILKDLINQGEFIKETHCFNEKMWQWIGKMSFTPSMYPVINNDLFSFAPNQNAVWRHGQLTNAGNPNCATFYGTSFKSYLKWISNEHPEYTKVFDNLNLTASGDVPFSIKFATEDQILEYNPFIQNNLAHDGVYKENQWKIPIGAAVVINPTVSNVYAVGSHMRGKYLDIEIVYDTQKQFYVKSALLFNRISKI